jgi:hypothetical protein
VNVDDFFESYDGPFGEQRTFRREVMKLVRAGPLEGSTDVEVAVLLARLVHQDLESFGTAGGNELTDDDMRTALQALRAVAERVGVSGFDPPFRDFTQFRSWWIRNGARGSWQARRDLLEDLFEPLHSSLAELEAQALSATLVAPGGGEATGWASVDQDLRELRRHYLAARTPQDFRAIGNDCVHITEALSRVVYDPARHLRPGEEEPPVDKTKQRIGRFVEEAAPGPDNAAIRKLAIASIELAQHVKHSATPTQREAGIAADAVIQLSHILRRLGEES